MFALLLRYIETSGARANNAVAAIFTIIAIASMFAGNILALLQSNVKRILAYSSIAHLGYILVSLQAGDRSGLSQSRSISLRTSSQLSELSASSLCCPPNEVMRQSSRIIAGSSGGGRLWLRCSR